MKRFGGVLFATAVVLVLVVGILLAQQEEGDRAGPPDRSEWEQERLNRALTEARLIGAERDAAEAAAEAKQDARRELFSALGKLRETTDDVKATDEQLTKAMAAYRKALAEYRGVVESQDRALEGKLSVRSQARCLAIGILDNGLWMGGMRRGRDGGRGRRGAGPGGGRRGRF